MTDYKDGDTITVNGKPCRIEDGALVPVVKRGPLGGELKRLGECQNRERVFVSALVFDRSGLDFEGAINEDYLVETNIPPRPTFTPTTAGEAAKLPDIVGRWIAVKVDDSTPETPGVPLSASGCWFGFKDQILLIEGVDL